MLLVPLVGAALARPVLTPPREPVARIVAVDVSRAAGDAAKRADSAGAYLDGAAAVILFDSAAREVAHGAADSLRVALVDDVRSRAEGELPSIIRLYPALAANDQEGARLCLDQAIEERQPMVLWFRLMGIVTREEPWVRERLARIWPKESSAG